jgi:hypothetical protein
MILYGGFGYCFSCTSFVATEVEKKDSEAAAVESPTAKPAKCLILSLTTEMPRSSLEFNSNTRREKLAGDQSSRHKANATLVFPGGKREEVIKIRGLVS